MTSADEDTCATCEQWREWVTDGQDAVMRSLWNWRPGEERYYWLKGYQAALAAMAEKMGENSE